MVNVNKLKGKIIENGMNVSDLAEIMGIDTSTLYRKLSRNGENISIKEADKISKVLKLTPAEASSIFFSQYIAYNANSRNFGGGA